MFDHLGGGNEILGLVKDPGIVGIERVIEGDGMARFGEHDRKRWSRPRDKVKALTLGCQAVDEGIGEAAQKAAIAQVLGMVLVLVVLSLFGLGREQGVGQHKDEVAPGAAVVGAGDKSRS